MMLTNTLDEIRNKLEADLPETLRFLKDLVDVNSFTSNASGVDRNAELIIRQFAPLGFHSRQYPSIDPLAGKHLVLDSGGDGPPVALISHLDTVYPAEEEARNSFAWKQEGDRIFGPGTVDIKGGTAMMWQVLNTFASMEPAFFRAHRWILLLDATEETLSSDFAQICQKELPTDTRACLIFEGDGRSEKGFALVRGRKGRGSFEISVSGRGAHAGGRHREGANAIHEAARIVERLSLMTCHEKGTTVNVGFIQGGTVINRVPHETLVKFEVRAIDPSDYERVRQAILALNGPGSVQAISDGFACNIVSRIVDETIPWPENSKTQNLIDLWSAAAEMAGLPMESDVRGGLSDGNYLWDKFPTLDGLGPRGNNAHASERSPDGTKLPEHVDASSFVPKSLINVIAIRQLLA